MGYLKTPFRPRRSFRRSRRFGRSYAKTGRSTGFRRYRRRYTRRPTYRRRMTSKKVRNIAAAKKYDTMLGATGVGEIPVPSSLSIPAGSTYMIWCPTYRPHDEASNPHHRNSQRVFWRGVRERVLLSASFELTHRRVCFWSYRRFEEAVPYQDEAEDVWRRPLRTITPDGSPDLFEELWKGHLDLDYTEDTRWNSPIDNRRFTIVSDKQYTINPNYQLPQGSSFGKTRTSKFWHVMNSTMMYDSEEAGSDDLDSPWAAVAPGNCANYYVLDIFSTGQSLEGDQPAVGTFSTTAGVYWHEQN